jgi:HNH endonuclease
VNAILVQQVWQRAAGRCEYCCLPVNLFPLTFHVDHITPRQHGGVTALDNLALACLHCNRHEGPSLAGIDPMDEELVKLFHQRRDLWRDHFEWRGTNLISRTAIGRGTVQVLAINAPDFKAVRESLQSGGRFPAD